MVPERCPDARFQPSLLEVDVRTDALGREQRKRVVEARDVVGKLMRRVGEHQATVRVREHVELDVVAALRDPCAQRLERVLRRERGGAAMPDPDRRPVAAQRLSRRGRQEVLVEPAALGRVREDHPVGHPLDGRAVVGPWVARAVATGGDSPPSTSSVTSDSMRGS